jgi:hypothetical protein
MYHQKVENAQDALELELNELRLDTTWKKGCVPFLVAFKNRVVDLENLRDTSNPVTDHEKRTWLSRSLLMHAEMRRSFGNLESNELLLRSTLPSVPGIAPPGKLPFPELYEYMLDQAHKIDAAVKQTSKETRRLHETETRPPRGGRYQGRGFGCGTGRGRGCGSSVPYLDPEKWATMTWEERTEHHKKRAAAYAANKARRTQTTGENAVGHEQPVQ